MTKRISGVLGACLLMAVFAFAKGPMPDSINVTFPFPVVVNHMTLAPGTYEFQRNNSVTPAVFTVVSSDNKTLGTTTLGLREEVGTASATDVAQSSYVVVDEIGGQHYLDALFMQGQNRGFRFSQAEQIRNKVEQAGNSVKQTKVPVTLRTR